MRQTMKKKVYVYLMGKMEENNSIVRAVEVVLDSDNTFNDIIDFLFAESKIKTKSVWGSLKQNGTKLNEFITIRDMESIIQESEGEDISLFVYINDNLRESNSPVKSHRNQPIVFELVPDNQSKVQEMEEIRLATSAKSVRLVPTQQSFNNQMLQTQNFAQNRPRRISKKSSLKAKSKNECCLLM